MSRVLNFFKEKINNNIIQNLHVNCDDTLDLFKKPTEGKLIICTHYYGFLDPLYFAKFLEKNIDNINPNEKFNVVIKDYFNNKFCDYSQKVIEYFKPDFDFEKSYYYLYKMLNNNSFDAKAIDILEKKNIAKDRSSRIKKTLNNNNNVVMFVNGTSLSNKLFSIIKDANITELYLIEMKLGNIESHTELNKLVYNKLIESSTKKTSIIHKIKTKSSALFFRIKSISNFIKNTKNCNELINMSVKNVKIDSNEFDFETYKKISNDFFTLVEQS